MRRRRAPTAVEPEGLAAKTDGNNVNIDREARLLAENALRFQSPPTRASSKFACERRFRKERAYEPLICSFDQRLGDVGARQRTELLVENLANSDTTRTPEGGPYRRKDAVFVPDPSIACSLRCSSPKCGAPVGVAVPEVVTDKRDPEKRYLPGHPDADKDGYVAYPRMNPAEDMVDLLGASRGYQANVSAVSAVKDMIQRSLDLFR